MSFTPRQYTSWLLPENGPANPCSGPTPEKMEQCRWIKPKLVCQVAFVEWTGAGHLSIARSSVCGMTRNLPK